MTQIPAETSTAGYQPEPLNLSGSADATGVCRVASQPVPRGWRWLIEYFVSTVETSAFPELQVFIDDDSSLANLLDGSPQGAAAVADYPRPRQIPGGHTVVAVWSDCNAGDRCNLRVEYRREAE